jgi:hypothetical protein
LLRVARWNRAKKDVDEGRKRDEFAEGRAGVGPYIERAEVGLK